MPAPGTNIVNKYDIREATNFTTRTDAAEFLKTRISNELGRKIVLSRNVA